MDERAFVIDTDAKADWAIGKIREEEAEAKRLLDLVEQKRAELDEKERQIEESLKSNTSFLKASLAAYMETVKTKETKTQNSYKLLSGTLIKKKDSYRYERNDAEIITWAEASGKGLFIDTVKKLRWADLKENLQFDGEDVIDPDTGEKVPGITAVFEPGKFEVK